MLVFDVRVLALLPVIWGTPLDCLAEFDAWPGWAFIAPWPRLHRAAHHARVGCLGQVISKRCSSCLLRGPYG